MPKTLIKLRVLVWNARKRKTHIRETDTEESSRWRLFARKSLWFVLFFSSPSSFPSLVCSFLNWFALKIALKRGTHMHKKRINRECVRSPCHMGAHGLVTFHNAVRACVSGECRLGIRNHFFSFVYFRFGVNNTANDSGISIGLSNLNERRKRSEN